MSVSVKVEESALAAAQRQEGGMAQGLASLLSKCAEVSIQNAHVSQHGEVLTVSHNSSDSGDLSQVIAEQRTGLGIMVFSSACKMLYANQAAYRFLMVLNRRENGHATHGALPVSIAGLFDEIRKTLETRIANCDQERLAARRLVVGKDQPVLLQAFGLSDRLGMQRSRIVITMRGGVRSLEAGPSEVTPSSI